MKKAKKSKKSVTVKTLKTSLTVRQGRLHLGGLKPTEVELGESCWFKFNDESVYPHAFKIMKTEIGQWIGMASGQYGMVTKLGGKFIDITKGTLFAFNWSI